MNTEQRISKISEDVAYMRGKIDSLPCAKNGSSCLNIKQKAVIGTGFTGAAAALLLSILQYIGVLK